MMSSAAVSGQPHPQLTRPGLVVHFTATDNDDPTPTLPIGTATAATCSSSTSQGTASSSSAQTTSGATSAGAGAGVGAKSSAAGSGRGAVPSALGNLGGKRQTLLSKSSENLASVLRKKAAAQSNNSNVATSTGTGDGAARGNRLRANSTVGLGSVTTVARTGALKAFPPSQSKLAATPSSMRKSTSVQSINTTGASAQVAGRTVGEIADSGRTSSKTPMKGSLSSRAQSVQNIARIPENVCRIPVSIGGRGTKVGAATAGAAKQVSSLSRSAGSVRRTSSTQNMFDAAVGAGVPAPATTDKGETHVAVGRGGGGGGGSVGGAVRGGGGHGTVGGASRPHRAVFRSTSSTVNAAALCNAELLANFEREKKAFERRISELIQTSETRRAETERLKFEIRDLREKQQQQELLQQQQQVAAAAPAAGRNAGDAVGRDELALLRAEIQLLRERLRENGLTPTEPFTDNEKLYILQQLGSGGGGGGATETEDNDRLSVDSRGGQGASREGRLSTDGSLRLGPPRPASEGGDTYNLDREFGLSVGNLSNVTSRHTSLDFSMDRRRSLSADRGLNLSIGGGTTGGEGGRGGGGGGESMTYLYDCLHQMQEQHYSTNEELQATHQELTDLQTSVNDLSLENERLVDEKSILLESLCAQTEKLENSRRQVEHLKALLIGESGAKNIDRSENELQLVELVKSAEVEREELLLRLSELNNVVGAVETDNRELQELVNSLREKISGLESALSTARRPDRKPLEKADCLELTAVSMDEVDGSAEEKLGSGKENQSENIKPCLAGEQNIDNCDKLDGKQSTTEDSAVKVNAGSAGQENLSGEVREPGKQAAVSCGGRKDDGTLERLKDEHVEMALRTDDLEHRLSMSIMKEAQSRQEARFLASTLRATELDLVTSRRLADRLRKELQECAESRRTDQEQWLQFQRDLQIAVVVANDIKSEVEETMDSVRAENQQLRERCAQLSIETTALRQERDRLRVAVGPAWDHHDPTDSPAGGSIPPGGVSGVTGSDIRDKVISTVDREFAVLRRGRNSGLNLVGLGVGLLGAEKGVTSPSSPSLPTKHLIASIEEQVRLPLSPQRLRFDMSDGTAFSVGKEGTTSGQEFKVETESLYTANHVSLNPTAIVTTPSNTPVAESSINSATSGPVGKNVKPHVVVAGTGVTGLAVSYNEGDSRTSVSVINGSSGDVTAGTELKKPVVGILTKSKIAPGKKASIGASDITEKLIGQEKTTLTSYSTTPGHLSKSDPLAQLAKQLGGSKRNALLKWCQNRTASYSSIDITNFSSSWDDGLAFCALLHTYLPELIPYKELTSQDKMNNFRLAFRTTESVGIPQGPFSTKNVHQDGASLPGPRNLNILIATDRPDWQAVFSYVTSIYKHFEVDNKALFT